MTATAMATRGRDRGVVTPVEMMFVLVFTVAAVVFIGFVGRLHAAGVQVSNTAQAAARAASLEASSAAGAAAAQDAVDRSSLATRCGESARAELAWQPSSTGSWQGGSVTVTVTCLVANDALTGVFTPGSRTIAASDTQPIDRYKR